MPTKKRFCEHCGASVSEEANFCSKCGNNLHGYAADSDILVCQNCGHSMTISPNDETIAECPACGSKKLIRNDHKIRMHELTGKEKDSKRSFIKWMLSFFFGDRSILLTIGILALGISFFVETESLEFLGLFTIGIFSFMFGVIKLIK